MVIGGSHVFYIKKRLFVLSRFRAAIWVGSVLEYDIFTATAMLAKDHKRRAYKNVKDQWRQGPA